MPVHLYVVWWGSRNITELPPVEREPEEMTSLIEVHSKAVDSLGSMFFDRLERAAGRSILQAASQFGAKTISEISEARFNPHADTALL